MFVGQMSVHDNVHLAVTPHHLKCLAVVIHSISEYKEQVPVGFARLLFQLS